MLKKVIMKVEITLKQLSLISGYSISTVSKALKNKTEISLKTRNVIKALAQSYNYIPNNSAVALRSKKTNTIAVVVPKIDNILYSSFLNCIQEEVSKTGYYVLLQQYSNYKKGSYAYLENLRFGSVDGVIIIQSKPDMAFAGDVFELSPAKNHPIIVHNIEDENRALDAYDYRILSKEIVNSLFSKIES